MTSMARHIYVAAQSRSYYCWIVGTLELGSLGGQTKLLQQSGDKMSRPGQHLLPVLIEPLFARLTSVAGVLDSYSVGVGLATVKSRVASANTLNYGIPIDAEVGRCQPTRCGKESANIFCRQWSLWSLHVVYDN